MNRVRIVAVTAVALGVAVVAGTHFQQPTAPSETAPAALATAPQPVAPPSLASLAESEAPPITLRAATVVGSLPVSQPTVAAASVLPQVEILAPLTPDDVDPLGALLASADPASTVTPDVPLQPLDPQLQAELNACAVWLVVTPSDGAMLETSIYAPCDGGAQVTLTHAGLSFDTRLGSDGQMMLAIPALVETATVSMTFADGREQSDSTIVPDLAGIERVALHWQGPATLALHAYEFGAEYGQAGHVHPGSAAPSDGITHGFLTVLGDPEMAGSHLAQVYSYPRGASSRQGQVTLEIEVPVTDASCGTPLQVDTYEVHGTVSSQLRQIQVEMPACDGNGGYLLLPGVLPELQIALN